MAMSRISGNQAYAHMHQWELQHRSGFLGRCHATCQNAWGLPVKYQSAIDAWNHVPKKHQHTDLSKIPVGAPIFLEGGSFGHVCLQSPRIGWVISTDAPTPDFIGEVPLNWFVTHWGKKVLGWASNYNDVDLDFASFPTKG
jgi:hypothetical protein